MTDLPVVAITNGGPHYVLYADAGRAAARTDGGVYRLDGALDVDSCTVLFLHRTGDIVRPAGVTAGSAAEAAAHEKHTKH